MPKTAINIFYLFSGTYWNFWKISETALNQNPWWHIKICRTGHLNKCAMSSSVGSIEKLHKLSFCTEKSKNFVCLFNYTLCHSLKYLKAHWIIIHDGMLKLAVHGTFTSVRCQVLYRAALKSYTNISFCAENSYHFLPFQWHPLQFTKIYKGCWISFHDGMLKFSVHGTFTNVRH